jgi:hypothetical protein
LIWLILNNKIKAHYNSVQKVVKLKLSLITQRIFSLYFIKSFTVPVEYYDIPEFTSDFEFDNLSENESKDTEKIQDKAKDAKKKTDTIQKYTEVSVKKSKFKGVVESMFMKKKTGQISKRGLTRNLSIFENVTSGDHTSKGNSTKNISGMLGLKNLRLVKTFHSDVNLANKLSKKASVRNESEQSLDMSIQDELARFQLPLVIDNRQIDRHVVEMKKHNRSIVRLKKMNIGIHNLSREGISEDSREDFQPKLAEF